MLPTSPAAPCGPRLLPKVSLQRKLSIAYSCETPRHSTNVIVPLSCASFTFSIAIFIAVLFRSWRSCGSFFHSVRGAREGAFIGQKAQIPSTCLVRFYCFDSAHFTLRAGLQTDPLLFSMFNTSTRPLPPLLAAPIILRLPFWTVESLSL